MKRRGQLWFVLGLGTLCKVGVPWLTHFDGKFGRPLQGPVQSYFGDMFSSGNPELVDWMAGFGDLILKKKRANETDWKEADMGRWREVGS